jgi:hypothetical protein
MSLIYNFMLKYILLTSFYLLSWISINDAIGQINFELTYKIFFLSLASLASFAIGLLIVNYCKFFNYTGFYFLNLNRIQPNLKHFLHSLSLSVVCWIILGFLTYCLLFTLPFNVSIVSNNQFIKFSIYFLLGIFHTGRYIRIVKR